MDTADSVARLNQLIVHYPKVTAPLVEKMRLQLAMRDWPQALDSASRVLSLEPNNLAALEVCVLGNEVFYLLVNLICIVYIF